MVFFEITHLEVSYRYRNFNSQTTTKIAAQKNNQAILACQRQSPYENCKKIKKKKKSLINPSASF